MKILLIGLLLIPPGSFLNLYLIAPQKAWLGNIKFTYTLIRINRPKLKYYLVGIIPLMNWSAWTQLNKTIKPDYSLKTIRQEGELRLRLMDIGTSICTTCWSFLLPLAHVVNQNVGKSVFRAEKLGHLHYNPTAAFFWTFRMQNVRLNSSARKCTILNPQSFHAYKSQWRWSLI